MAVDREKKGGRLDQKKPLTIEKISSNTSQLQPEKQYNLHVYSCMNIRKCGYLRIYVLDIKKSRTCMILRVSIIIIS